VGFKLAEGKGLREGWDSKELWKSVENYGKVRDSAIQSCFVIPIEHSLFGCPRYLVCVDVPAIGVTPAGATLHSERDEVVFNFSRHCGGRAQDPDPHPIALFDGMAVKQTLSRSCRNSRIPL